MRQGELGDVGSADLQRDDRLRPRHSADRVVERAAVIDTLDVQADDLRRVVLGEEVENLGKAHVRRVPQPDAEPQSQALAAGEEAHREVHASTARDDRGRTALEPRHVGHEVGHHAVHRVHEPRGVGPEQAHAVSTDDRRDLGLEGATASRLGEPSGAYHHGFHTTSTAVLERRWHGPCRHDEHREIDGRAQGRHRSRD